MQPPNDPLRQIDVPDRGATPPADRASFAAAAQQQAAANVVRSQIDSLFDQATPAAAQTQAPIQSQTAAQPAPAQQTLRHSVTVQPLSDTSAYARTHDDEPKAAAAEPHAWQQYHSAWQNYYQQYYERYYVGQVYQARQSIEQQTPLQPGVMGSTTASDGTMTEREALNDLRGQLRHRLGTATKRVRGSRHFIPIASGIGVMIVFAFLQFNSMIFGAVAAYTSPGQIDQASIIIDPTANPTVDPAPKLIIPKINVDVPVDWNAGVNDASQMAAMQNGVAYFNATGALPGQVGNVPIAGHSSNDFFETGNYKFIFAKLDQLVAGDTIYLNYHSVRYTYSVTKSRVVGPNDASALREPTTKPLLTLITCTPLGTSLNRLLVTAEQVSPNPANASAVAPSTPSPSGNMPGNAPSLLEKIFGAR